MTNQTALLVFLLTVIIAQWKKSIDFNDTDAILFTNLSKIIKFNHCITEKFK